LLNFDGGPALLKARYPAPGYEFQLTFIVQLRRPADREFQAFPWYEDLVGGEKHPITTDVNGLTSTLFAAAALIEDPVPDFPLDWESICGPPLNSTFFTRRRRYFFRKHRFSPPP
jgi:hypothetical protein